MKLIYKSMPNSIPKLEAFNFQIKAAKSIRDLEYSAIFHEQGLGKTKIAIDILLYWLESKILDTIVIVVKKALLTNWVQELKTHCYIRPAILSQNKSNNYFVFNRPSRIILTNYEVLISESDRFKLFLNTRDVGIILDESTKIKNPNSAISKIVFELSPNFKKRVIMSGTPIANRPYDIWGQIYFLDNGKSLGTDFNSFKRQYNLTNDLHKSFLNQHLFENAINSIMEKISSFSIRETKKSNVISLPAKVYNRIETTWESIQHELYCQIRDELRATVIKEGIPRDDISDNVLKRLLRLVQIASNPKLVDESYSLLPGKFEYLTNLVHRININSEKCIVWTTFTENVDWLYLSLSEYGTCKVHGKMDVFQRNRNIDLFKSDPNRRVLIATPGSAKEGLTLTVANHVIFYDRGFSLDDYLQAQDRIHRISQKSTCYIYNLIMRNSIDEWVELLLNAKELAAKLALGDISLEYYKNQIKYDYGTMINVILNIEE